MNNITICTSKQLILTTARHNEGINLGNYEGLAYFISDSRTQMNIIITLLGETK